jgi:lipopolysaccharide/colanic/teichoic acid biosynthesis glycosyltransferase
VKRLGKRLFDLGLAILGLILLWPVFLAIAILIKLEDRGPVFYLQERIGYRGKPFRIWKFRTMVVDAEKLGKPLTIGKDPRITRVGYWLRKYKLDELPQLLNVVFGQMSFVGPRPELPCYVALYTPEQREILDFLPGITSPASIKYSNESELLAQARDPEKFYIEQVMPEKIKLDLEYFRNATLWSDLVIILKTLGRIVHSRFGDELIRVRKS